MITMTLGWGAIAALLGWSALVFWLGRRSIGERPGHDLSGPPVMPRPAPRASGAAVRHDPASLSPGDLAAIHHELARGNTINAIKLMRDATGMGLPEAKHAVEAMGG